MTIKEYKLYLEPDVYKKLLAKAQELGYTGRGAISHFISKIAQERLIFIDQNLREFSKLVFPPETRLKE